LQPNCFTQIVPHDGRKKIVIYAKRDIEAGEELCYDYKFPIEDDESKKIVCRCGAQRCRGHMN
jgi:SET domain-containing protein